MEYPITNLQSSFDMISASSVLLQKGGVCQVPPHEGGVYIGILLEGWQLVKGVPMPIPARSPDYAASKRAEKRALYRRTPVDASKSISTVSTW